MKYKTNPTNTVKLRSITIDIEIPQTKYKYTVEYKKNDDGTISINPFVDKPLISSEVSDLEMAQILGYLYTKVAEQHDHVVPLFNLNGITYSK